MRKRIAAVCENSHQIRKRKRVYNNEKKPQQKSVSSTDSSESNEELSDSQECSSPERKVKNPENSSFFDDGSPKPEYILSRDLVNGTILTDIAQKRWRIGKPIGKGSFGEIFLASDEINTPVTSSNAKYVVKIEPHSNGPLFVEIHCLLNTTSKQSDSTDVPLPGLPNYIASGSHYFRETRYRFLVIPRFDRDLRSLIKHRKVDQKSLITLAIQIIDVLEMLHDKGYCHSDIKAENLMISKCTTKKQKFVVKPEVLEENGSRFRSRKQKTSSSDSDSEDVVDNYSEDEGNCSQSESVSDDDLESGSSSDNYKTPISRRNRPKLLVEYGGSNPVRSCRVNNGRSREQKTGTPSSIYQEMVSSHYLRPSKRISYSEFFLDDQPLKAPSSQYNSISNNTAATANNTQYEMVTEERIFLIDFGLASKFIDSSGVHRPFFTDQRRAHDGTLEFTSRDAHLGAHSRRSDLECFGYNLIFWSEGYLPWKEYASQQQLEKVHWMKEYLMKDVREMLNHIYGKSVPKYLGEYMHYVGKLGYQERPDYDKCKQMFLREYKNLGYDVSKMSLKSEDIAKNALRVLENNNFCELKHIKSIMKNLGVIMPLTLEPSSASRISPKSLRSKSDKKEHRNSKGEKKNGEKKKKFSWTEILSQDPDQIARERAEKEFERDINETPLIKYTGKPTYAILDIERRLKMKSEQSQCENITDTEVLLEGYNRPMMEILKKKQASQMAELDNEAVAKKKSKPHCEVTKESKVRGRPRKVPKVKPESTVASTFTTTDESSSSSDSSAVNSPYKVENFGSSMEGVDSSSSGSTSDEHSSPVKTRHNAKPNGMKVVKTNPNCLYSGMNGGGGGNGMSVNSHHHSTDETDGKLIGARRRKRNVPKKSNGGVTKVIRKIKSPNSRNRIKRERFSNDYFYDYEVANYTSDDNVDDDDDDEFIPNNMRASHFEIEVGLASGRHYKKGVRRGGF
ncbi:VRK1.2 family protein [Megaselia abdita]